MTNKLTTAILAFGLAAGTAWAQNPSIIQSTHDTMKALQSKDQAASDDALGNTAKASAQSPAARQSVAITSGSRKAAAKTAGHSARPQVVAQKKAAKNNASVAVDNGNRLQFQPGAKEVHFRQGTTRSFCQSRGQPVHGGLGLQRR